MTLQATMPIAHENDMLAKKFVFLAFSLT